MDSSLAGSMNPQVLTMITSASSASSETVYPLSSKSLCMRSESTVFLGHPKVMRLTVGIISLCQPFGMRENVLCRVILEWVYPQYVSHQKSEK